MKTIRTLWLGFFTATILLNANLQAEDIGLEVGEQAPAFKLNNQEGKKVSLEDLIAKHDIIALVFYRSADWCPFCQRQLIDLQNNLDTLTELGIELVGISYDSVEAIQRFGRKEAITFSLLSDPGSNTIDDYQVRNTQVRPGRAEGIPHPVIFLVNKKGEITAKLMEEGYRERPSVEVIISAAEAMD